MRATLYAVGLVLGLTAAGMLSTVPARADTYWQHHYYRQHHYHNWSYWHHSRTYYPHHRYYSYATPYYYR
jgi:hypothetical protein